jgi:hypothetical protein
MKPFIESLGSKNFQRCSKPMPKGPPTNKRDMCKNVALKESIESSRTELG